MNNKKGLSIVEMMMVVAILTALMAGVTFTLAAGSNTWENTDVHIHLQDDLRMVLSRVSKEIRESGSNNVGTMQLAIADNTGVNNTDVITFSVPVVCEATGSIMDINGDVANWGAPLTWGCTDSTCMDADDDCATVDYSSVRYLIDGSNQLLRRVLDTANSTVREDIFAHNVTDFQAALSGDQNVITLTVTVSRDTNLSRTLSATNSFDVYLRNRG